MSEIKTSKFIENLPLSYQEFSLLLFGVVSKIDFINRPINKTGHGHTKWLKEIFSLKDKLENPQIEKFLKAKDLINDFKRRALNGSLPKQINEAVLKKPDANPIKFQQSNELFIPDDVWKLVMSNTIDVEGLTYTKEITYRFQFNDLLIFFTEEFETNSHLFADWVYPLLGLPVPDNRQLMNNSTVILNKVEIPKEDFIKNNAPEEYVRINELPKLIQLAIRGYEHFNWDNLNTNSPSEKYKSNALNYLHQEARSLSLTHLFNDNGKMSTKLTDQLVRIINPDNDAPK